MCYYTRCWEMLIVYAIWVNVKCYRTRVWVLWYLFIWEGICGKCISQMLRLCTHNALSQTVHTAVPARGLYDLSSGSIGWGDGNRGYLFSLNFFMRLLRVFWERLQFLASVWVDSWLCLLDFIALLTENINGTIQLLRLQPKHFGGVLNIVVLRSSSSFYMSTGDNQENCNK